MKLREVICNRDLKGMETQKMIDKLHDGIGCPIDFGIGEIACNSSCSKCYDKDSNSIKGFDISFNRKNLIHYNNGYIGKKVRDIIDAW